MASSRDKKESSNRGSAEPAGGRVAIDLRSDTVTRPNEKMRRAMAEAAVGDDVFLEDPTVNRLQEKAARMFGREAALLVPSGTMGNLICMLCLTEPGQEVICERDSHIYNYEMGSMAAFAGVLPRIVDGREGILDWDDVEKAIRPSSYYLSQTSLLCLENTHNLAGGAVYPTRVARGLCDHAHEAGLKVHLDGARIFNAAVALGQSVAEITQGFDSLSFCLSKGLGAPIGSVVVGSGDFIEQARRARKRLGGGMRQVGILAAAALVALEDSPARLHEDHDNARWLADRLAEMPGIAIDPKKVQTNIVIFDVSGTGMENSEFVERLASEGILALPFGQRNVRMLTHCDVSRPDIENAVEALKRIVT
ncbi:low-specificity L-threonine aldolase [Candidatus Sumerlaeota bacterium]|nr:low-specificity L-threonine aldolase [Candidatus Sumerlaeota bacterium]